MTAASPLKWGIVTGLSASEEIRKLRNTCLKNTLFKAEIENRDRSVHFQGKYTLKKSLLKWGIAYIGFQGNCEIFTQSHL